MNRNNNTDCSSNQELQQNCACSLCGQLYNNFVFKGGYICEDCLESIKDETDPSIHEEPGL